MEFGQQQPRTVIDGCGGSREELIPGLPHDVAVECFLRLPHTALPSACCVSKSWRSLLHGRHFYALRRSLHRTRSLTCLVQQSPPYTSSTDRHGAKPAVGTDHLSQSTYLISVFDPGSLSWARVPPIPDFPDGLPLFCQLASTDGKLLVLGGWDPVTYCPLRRVYLHDFVAGEWQRCADMPVTTTFFGAAGVDGGRVFMAGGHDEYKNALGSAWAYDVELNIWEEMEGMSQERDECEGVVVGGGTEFWVVSGYRTKRQGGFEGSADVYEIGEGGRPWRRRRVEGAWQERKCPRGGVCPMNGSAAGSVFNLGEAVSGVQAGMCSVSTSRKVIVFEYQGGKLGIYVAEREEEEKIGKFMKVEVPEEFSGFVQSCCCVEV
ncbi:hypothetical protein MLD38_003386 [Melastoma candidum]|uniref:Uncharacterized protein n=1 Tax=Melastoma candidum TaxID=119954 RepID=A0ACB9S4D2_9MYRT|nr:hypothetical protein MLD38_003386 [Melastoma candidum]